MLRFKNLSSGSTGNATLIEATGGVVANTTRLLVDCGLGLQRMTTALDLAGVRPSQIDAIFITHEHGDHLGCVVQLASRYSIPVWASNGTHAVLKDIRLRQKSKRPDQTKLVPDFDDLVRIAQDTCPVDLGELQFNPFTVPHDAREPLQLSCTDGNSKLGILTDLGHASHHVREQLSHCHALLLESNHDTEMLAKSSYPPFLKSRVGGDFGHLSNMAAAEILDGLQHPGLRQVIAAHLSQQNNKAELVQNSLSRVLGCLPTEILIAQPDVGTPWLTV
jgi:phosphoribosyl 1,2-cyclic phosphodiesterase